MIAVLLAASLLASASARADDADRIRANAALVLGSAAISPPPASDPALVELGRRLFFEPALSPGRDRSCASCHDPARAWAGGARAPGGRDVPSLLGAARPGPFFVDGRAETLEDAVLSELRDPRAMGLDDRALSARLEALTDAADPLAAAGESGADAARAARALAAFLRAEAVSGGSAFDRAAADPSALSASAARGLALFAGKGRCATCHSGPWLTDGHFYDVGLRAGDPLDVGRAALTPIRPMRGAFRTPPLRDVARTAPYMHDGSLKTLRDVVDFFDRGGDEILGLSRDVTPVGLTADEKDDLVAFLSALDGAPRAVAAARFPAAVPRAGAAALDAARSARARARRAEAARDRGALRDAADEWARLLAAARPDEAGAGKACLTNAASAAGDLAEMSATGRGWPILKTRLELAAEWSRECAFRAARAAGGSSAEEEVSAAPGATRADALLDRARSLEDARRASSAGGPAERACRADFSFDGLLARLRARPYDDDAEQNVMKQALVYRTDEAVRRGDESLCDALTFTSMAVGEARTGAQRCRQNYADLAGARALFARSPSYVGLCRENIVLSSPGFPDAEAASVCREILAGIDDPAALCARLTPRVMPESLRGACVARFRLFSRGGSADDCRALEAGPSIIRDDCLDMAAFAVARAAGDAARCGGSTFCRLLMGAGREQEAAQLEKLKAAACRPLPVPASLARVVAILDEADAALASAAPAASGRAAAAALDARAERAARLRLEAAAIFAGTDAPPTLY